MDPTIRTLDFLWVVATLVVGGWLAIIDPSAEILRRWVDHNFFHYLIMVVCGPVWFMTAVGLHYLSEHWGI
jgi:hypothetical protein